VEGGNGSPPAVTGNEAASAVVVCVVVDGPSPRSARFSISVDGGTDSDLVVSECD
jgi:hypothetical protein